MQLLLALCFLLSPIVYGAVVNVNECAWGESYWCSELSRAKACGAVAHCKTTVWKNQVSNNDSSEVCEFCQAIITDVHKFIGAKETEDQISHFLSTACAIIPSQKAANECKTIVEEYTPEIIDLILSDVTPRTMCDLIHLCSGNALRDNVRHSPASPSIIRIPLGKSESNVHSHVHDQKICTDCKAFFGDIVDEITSPAMEKQLEDLIDTEICAQLPASYKDECTQLVHAFLPMAISYLQEYMNATVICESLQFCYQTTDKSRVLFESLKATPFYNTLRKLVSAESCVVCKEIVSELQAMDRNTAIQSDIKDFLKNEVCGKLGDMKNGCLEIIDAFAQQAFEFIATILDPDTRCRSFGFCPSDDSAVNVVREATQKHSLNDVKTSAECILCEYVMGEVDKLLENNKTEAQIIAALDKVCSILPKTVRQSCLDFINTYGVAIISILETEITPSEVCTFLGLCKAKQTVTKKIELKAGDAETCLICETLVQYVEALISENATVSEIEAAVEKICNFLPDTMKTQCNAVIEQYGALIVQYIVAKYDPKEVCTMIKLCDAVDSVRMVNIVPARTRLGTGKCTYGPSYWCVSQENADKCGAVEHCKKYVWKN